MNNTMDLNCYKDCDWHDDFSWACCNGYSPYVADFTDEDFYCEYFEAKDKCTKGMIVDDEDK